MDILSLNGIWKLRGKPNNDTGNEILLDAYVPGCVQLDLSRAGYLPEDLYMGLNILQTQKYETWQWWYTRSFIAPETRERVFLVFEGVDCVAHYYLNGIKIGDSRNMFIAHEFEVGAYLQDGENTITVHIESPVLYAHKQDYCLNSFQSWNNAQAHSGIRQAPHCYGWDIMPRAVTCGLWREVRLEVRDAISFSQMYFCGTSNRWEFYYSLECAFSNLSDLEIELEGSCKDSHFLVRQPVKPFKTGSIPVAIPSPYLWWPYGYGEANIYDAKVRIYRKGVCVHEATTHFGIRDVVLERSDMTDGENGCFRFIVNGTEIMCKGTNWVPLDAFHSRDTERYAQALALVKDIGCNILRCWGGNVYEDTQFYDFCDRNGIMVWQDFSMACTVYPQDDDFASLIREEAQAVVRKLRQHPSIILWAGDNEVDILSYGVGLDPSANRLTRQVLPQVVHCNDKYRPYLASSPYVSEAVHHSGNLRNCPENHLWGPRDYYKSTYYKNHPAHFVSETGYHGCPALESIRKFITADKVWPYQNNDQWILHSSNQEGNDSRVMLMHKQVQQLFGEIPSTPEAYIAASQISQAEAMKYFIERIRIGRPQKTGIIWWNLLDGWPQMSDAVVDYYFTKKLAYSYIKRSQAPFAIIAGEPENHCISICACNDTLIKKTGKYRILDGDTDEELLNTNFSVEANSTTVIGHVPFSASEYRQLLIQWETDGEKGFNHYLAGHPPMNLQAYRAFIKKFHLQEDAACIF